MCKVYVPLFKFAISSLFEIKSLGPFHRVVNVPVPPFIFTDTDPFASLKQILFKTTDESIVIGIGSEIINSKVSLQSLESIISSSKVSAQRSDITFVIYTIGPIINKWRVFLV